MITHLSEKYKLLILLNFTEELIKNSKTEETRILEEKLKIAKEISEEKLRIRKELERRELMKRANIPRQKIPNQRRNEREEQYTPSIQDNNFSQERIEQPKFNIDQRTKEIGRQKLIIPEVNLPERFKYLKPVPTKEEMNLGKLNVFIKNPQVREIECNGPDTEIIVKMPMPKKTEITLTSQEIQDIFEEFSKAAKIPVEENIIKIAAGNFILNGINSKVIGSKFIIKRIPFGLGMRQSASF